MRRAQLRSACLQQKFYFKQDLFDQDENAKPDTKEMTLNEILNGGTSGSNSTFPGLIPLIKQYLTQLDIDIHTNCKINTYLKLIEGKANGTLMTTASWMRKFVMSHPNYRHDSVVSNQIAYDLMSSLNKISNFGWTCPSLNKI